MSDVTIEHLCRLLDANTGAAATLKTANQIVERAKVCSMKNPELAHFMLWILRQMAPFYKEGRLHQGYVVKALAIALSLANRKGDLNRLAAGAISYARAKNWCGTYSDGKVYVTPETLEESREPTRAWDVPGLPDALRDLALALEKHGGGSAAKDILKQTGRNPSDTIKKYPLWEDWISDHIKRPRRGVYKLE